MGGGFTFGGNSAATRPPYFASSGIPINYQTPNSVTLDTGTESQPCHKNIGDCFLGPVPSRFEVERAILELQRFMRDLSASKSEDNGPQYGHDLEMLQSPGFIKFSDAFSMMQAEPSLRNLVTSISCDKSVWEAIMTNKAVQELRGSIYTAKEEKLLSLPEEPDIRVFILRWIMEFTKSKVLELVEKLGLLVNEFFQHAGSKEKATSELTDLLDEKVRSSFLLSVAILLIVVVTRGHG